MVNEDVGFVRAGQALIELDPTLAGADRQRLESDWVASSLELARWRAFSAWLDNGKVGSVSAASVDTTAIGAGSRIPVNESSVALQRSLLEQSIAQQRSKIAGIDQTLVRRRAEAESTRQVLEKLKQTLPLVTQRADSLKKLSEQNLVARNSYLEVEQERIEALQDLAAQDSNLVSTAAAISELAEQRSLALADTRRDAFEKIEELEKLEKQNRSQRQELIKASDIAEDQVLASPVDGVVQQLKVHTIGGVVTAADPLLVIVPKDQTLEVEARVLNKDIGFVRAGQPVTVKVESFPFTRYGVLKGTVTSVSRDAIAGEKLGLYYLARVRVPKGKMNIDGVDVQLSPGMAVTAEVTTGTRRLIEYLLSPVMQHVGESGRERGSDWCHFLCTFSTDDSNDTRRGDWNWHLGCTDKFGSSIREVVMQNVESRPTCKFHIENSVQRSLRALTRLQAREFVSKLLLAASLLSLACSAAESPKPAASPASEFKISVKVGKEPVCTAYAKRLEHTPLRRELEEKDGKWINNPHCDRGESVSPNGFELLNRVPLSVAEVTRLLPQVDAFLRSPTGSPNTVGRPDSTPVNPVVGSAEWRQTTAIKAGDHFYFYRFQPKVDIDNDGRADDVIVWKWWGGLCGEPDEGGKPRVLRTDVLVLNENGDLDMMRTRRIVGHPKGPVMVIQDPSDPSHPSEVMDTEFRSIGKTLGVFVYRGVTYFDTFYEAGGDLENRRDGAPNYLDTLAVLRNSGGTTSLVCEIVVK